MGKGIEAQEPTVWQTVNGPGQKQRGRGESVLPPAAKYPDPRLAAAKSTLLFLSLQKATHTCHDAASLLVAWLLAPGAPWGAQPVGGSTD